MSSDRPLVSVIVPTYNHGAFIREAVESVLQQTYDYLEVIVVDNCSTDNTSQVLSEINDPRLKTFKFDDQGVVAKVRNFGVKQSIGEVLAFLDADDQWDPNKLKLQLEHLKDGKISCVGTNFEAIGDTRYYKRIKSVPRGLPFRDYNYDAIARGNAMVLSSAIIRANDFIKVGGFDERREFAFIEDWALWLSLARCGLVRILAGSLTFYRIVRIKQRDKRAVALATLKLLDREKKLGYLSGSTLRIAEGNCYIAIGRACVEQHDARAVSYFFKGLCQTPGLRHRIRAAGGMALCCAPHRFRPFLIEMYYRVPVGK